MPTVTVRLGARSYKIEISAGLLEHLGHHARIALGESCRQAVIVSNATVGSMYIRRASTSLARAGFKTSRFLIGDGERFKNLRTAESLFTFLIGQRVERSDVIV